MSEFMLTGHISYAKKKKYKWIAEFGKNTCKKCASLNGKVFDEDKVPYWPHPNCRCKVEELSIIDPIDSEFNEYREELAQLKLQANELLGDTGVLREQIEKVIQESHNKEIESLESRLSHTEYEVYQIIDRLEETTRDTIDRFMIDKMQKEMEKIKGNIEEYANEYKGLNNKLKYKKMAVDSDVEIGSALAPDAAALWRLASSKFKRGLDYIEKNGKLINKVSELGNKDLEDTIKAKISKQLNTNESKGIVFNPNSSLSKTIANSSEFKKIILDKKVELVNNKVIPKISRFLNSSFNSILSIHGCDIINIKVINDKVYATVIDTIDYNKGEWWVKFPHDLQKSGAIENYYVIIQIVEPIEKYLK